MNGSSICRFLSRLFLASASSALCTEIQLRESTGLADHLKLELKESQEVVKRLNKLFEDVNVRF